MTRVSLYTCVGIVSIEASCCHSYRRTITDNNENVVLKQDAVLDDT